MCYKNRLIKQILPFETSLSDASIGQRALSSRFTRVPAGTEVGICGADSRRWEQQESLSPGVTLEGGVGWNEVG